MTEKQERLFKPGQIVRKEITKVMFGSVLAGTETREFNVTLVGRVTASGEYITLSKESARHAGRNRVPVTQAGWN